MNTPFRRLLLLVTAVLGLFIGAWAEFFSRSFYDSFPGLGFHWISEMGPFNDHLISDIGSFYLALTAITVGGLLARTDLPGRIAGLGWSVFGVLHFIYHAAHLMGSLADKVDNLIGLGISAVLGIMLVFPSRRAAAREEAR
jgi:hypothetical protein